MFGVMMWEAFESVETDTVCTPWGRAMSRRDVESALAAGTCIVCRFAVTGPHVLLNCMLLLVQASPFRSRDTP